MGAASGLNCRRPWIEIRNQNDEIRKKSEERNSKGLNSTASSFVFGACLLIQICSFATEHSLETFSGMESRLQPVWRCPSKITTKRRRALQARFLHCACSNTRWC